MEIKKVKLLNKDSLEKSLSIGSGCVIIHDNKVLLVRGRGGKEFKFPGGHIYDNENFLQSAERETFEEIGCKVKTYGDPIFYLFKLNDSVDIILIHYRANILEGIPQSSAEIEEIIWLDVNNIAVPVFDNVVKVINQILKERGSV